MPTFILGFSRGSVDTATYSDTYNKNIQGIILVSAIFENSSRKAETYSMERLIGNTSKNRILILHHSKDECHVTDPFRAREFYEKLTNKKACHQKFS